MNRRAPLILVAEPELVSSGLWPDRHALQTPLWEVAANVRFAGGKVQRRVPNILAFSAGAEPIRGLAQMQDSDGTRWTWAASGGRIVRWYGPAPEEIIAGLSFQEHQTVNADPTIFDFTNWGNWMIVNSADNGVRLHRPEIPSFAVIPDAPSNAVLYFKKRNQLLAVGYGTNRRMVGFSDADNIFDWDFTSTENLAGEIPLEEANSPIRSACHMGPSLAVFAENQMFAVNWIGLPFLYGQQKLLDGIGAVGKAAVCSVGRLAYGVSRNGVWRTDGTQPNYIDEVILRDYLQEEVNWDQAGKIVARYNDFTGMVEFSFPMRDSLDLNEGWAFDPRYGGWSRVPAFSHMDSRVLFDKPLQGQLDGSVELIERDATVDAPLKLETRALLIQRDNQALHINALIDEIEIFAKAADGVQFQYGVAEFPDGPWSWTENEEVQTKLVTYKPLSRISGTFHKLRFTSFKPEWELDLQGFALFGVADGLKREKA